MTWAVRSWLGDDPALPTLHGAAFLALDGSTIEPGLADRVQSLVDEIHAAPRAEGVERLYVPGEMEWERLAAARSDGVALPSDVLGSLREAAELSSLDLESYLERDGAEVEPS
jgi:LDH2 family malate/lactate/ureidoglycolate dehydrogenase